MSDFFVTPWTMAHQTPQSMRLLTQEYWSGLPFSSPRDLPNSLIKPVSPSLAGGRVTTEPPRNIYNWLKKKKKDETLSPEYTLLTSGCFID